MLAALAVSLTLFPSAAIPAPDERPLAGLDPDLRAALVSVDVKDVPLLDAFAMLRDQAFVNFAFDEHVPFGRSVSFTGRGRLAEVAPRLLEAAGLAANVYNAHTLLLYPDRPAKRWEYSAENPANAPGPRLRGRRAERGHVYELEDATVEQAFAAFAEHSGYEVTIDEEIDLGELLDFVTDSIAAATALELLCLKQGLTFQQRGRRHLLVYPATPEKMFEHDDPRTRGLTLADFEMPAVTDAAER